jgi:ribosome-associated heat shock protein Hsp15
LGRNQKSENRLINRQRIDKWLWHARIVRTRSNAAALALAGYVRLNGQRITAPGQPVRIGDVLTLAFARTVRVLQVEGLSDRRSSSSEARVLYRDLARDHAATDSPEANMPKRVAD